MQNPIQVTFRGMSHSDAVEAAVRKHADRLERFYGRIMSCRVLVDAAHGRSHQGGLYHVRIELGVPGGELVVGRDPSKHAAHADVYVAIRDAFRAVRRTLQDRSRRRRQDVKTHEAPSVGRVLRLFPTGHGFLETPDGREVYFHEHSVLGRFAALAVGDRVRFVEEAGDKGPQASSLTKLPSRAHRRSA